MTIAAERLADVPAGASEATGEIDAPENSVVLAALAADKREGLRLAVKTRWVALAIIAVLLVYLNPSWTVLYHELLIVAFALIGWAQLKVGRLGRSRPELALMFCDLALMTVTLVVPNPLVDHVWPTAMQFQFGTFVYFFVLLSFATLAYSWRTLVAMGVWTTALWSAGVGWVILQPVVAPELSAAVQAALAGHPRLLEFLDPNRVHVPIRVQELVVFLIVAGTLALSGWRANRLLIKQAGVERERANLPRYFSPNVVEELSHNDEPLKRVRTQDVAVLFVDIVGFTAMAAGRSPRQVIETLRDFHGRMEREVFAHGGTLDKYLGDGLMATFGTPWTGERDAGNALRCARAMIGAVQDCNAERAARGEPTIRAGFGIHYGPAVLGDIGANRLEFAVIGNTVNVASRLEALTRELGVALIASDALIERAKSEPEAAPADVAGLRQPGAQRIRGLDQPIAVWTLDVPDIGAPLVTD